MSTLNPLALLRAQGVSLGRDVFERFDNWLEHKSFSKVFFLVDENTHEHCLPALLGALSNLPEFEILEVEAGEESKSPEVLIHLYHALTELEADRQSLLVNVGGGVVCDLGGFLAATYMRGIPFIHFPTSLLAMVDASVGGKTGIDLGGHKNQVGVFARAEQVYVYPAFLETLPDDHVRSGFAEMLKHGCIADEAYLQEVLQTLAAGTLPTDDQIEQSIAIKARIVEADFREGGARKKLNFGHSLGHALEGACLLQQQPILHGDAVAFGMLGELWLSVRKLHFPENNFDALSAALRQHFGFLTQPLEREVLMQLLRGDKKNTAGSFRFVLLPKPGEACIDVEVDHEEAEAAFDVILKG
jgi:3-dehydroquinate synthase